MDWWPCPHMDVLSIRVHLLTMAHMMKYIGVGWCGVLTQGFPYQLWTFHAVETQMLINLFTKTVANWRSIEELVLYRGLVLLLDDRSKGLQRKHRASRTSLCCRCPPANTFGSCPWDISGQVERIRKSFKWRTLGLWPNHGIMPHHYCCHPIHLKIWRTSCSFKVSFHGQWESPIGSSLYHPL